MSRKFSSLLTVVFACGLMTSASYGQLDGVYEFDGGGDGTSWDDAINWEEVLDPFGIPTSGNPAAPPAAVTTADIPLAGVVIDATMPGQTALDVNIGTAAGAGSLSISGGDLTVSSEMFVGGGTNPGSLDVSGGILDALDDIELGTGSPGTMTQSNGAVSAADDFFIRASSSLTMTGGTIDVGDRLITQGDGTLSNDGGDIVADDDFFFEGTSQITNDSGSMIVADKLRMDDVGAKVTVNGGLVRSQEFGFCSSSDCSTSYVMNGILEINGSGVYQSEAPEPGDPISQLSINQAYALINAGTIITSETSPLGLVVQSVVVPDFFGNSNLTFTQISIGSIPEPTSVLLLGLGGLGLLLSRRRG